jgi:hypothetical protein
MANIQYKDALRDDFNPFRFSCDSCGKTKEYSEREIDKVKKPHPNPKEYAYDFFISCPFCEKGFMEPPEVVSFFGAFEEPRKQ